MLLFPTWYSKFFPNTQVSTTFKKFKTFYPNFHVMRWEELKNKLQGFLRSKMFFLNAQIPLRETTSCVILILQLLTKKGLIYFLIPGIIFCVWTPKIKKRRHWRVTPKLRHFCGNTQTTCCLVSIFILIDMK